MEKYMSLYDMVTDYGIKNIIDSNFLSIGFSWKNVFEKARVAGHNSGIKKTLRNF